MNLVIPPSLWLIIFVYFGIIVAFVVWVEFFAPPESDFKQGGGSDYEENQNQEFNLKKRLKELGNWK